MWVLTLPTRFSADPATGSDPIFLSPGLLGTDLDIPWGAAGVEESPFAAIGSQRSIKRKRKASQKTPKSNQANVNTKRCQGSLVHIKLINVLL
jgi:hypothetical protein